MASSVKKKYVAVVPLDFKKGDDVEQHIKVGAVLPDTIPAEDIKALLEMKAIKEKGKKD